jgi:CheY-like chemotaxis protein
MPKKILLADDSITIQKVVELTFSDGDYEVTAVNNGARAIQKLSEMRPDIILSDIIMPEKNGYEVCEFVKSHPDYRNIPVVLLTGTFEPFDPDRADKAGCDAVVTKPFESQSLIHKVEELIEHSRAASSASSAAAAAPAPAAAAVEAPSPWVDEVPAAETAPSPFSAAPSFAPPAEKDDSFTHGSDIFGAAPRSADAASSDMPFAPPPPESFFGAPATAPAPETSTQRFAAQPETPAAASPWDQPQPTGGETRAFPRMSFEDLEKAASTPTAAPPPPPDPSSRFDDTGDMDGESPFGASPAAETFSGETRAFPRMNFDELRAAASTPAPPPSPSPAPAAASSPWDEQPQATGGETKAFPRMSFDDLQNQMSAPAPAPAQESSPWDEAPAPASASSQPDWATPAEPEPEAPVAAPDLSPSIGSMGGGSGFAEPAADEMFAPAQEQEPAPAPVAAQVSSDLSEEQIERIARRVVQMLSDQVVRNIAWEVIPDLAEMVVKERIRQLEAEA